jgi:hypothetical protein
MSEANTSAMYKLNYKRSVFSSGGNSVVLYYIRAFEFWSDYRGGLIVEGLIYYKPESVYTDYMGR